MGGPEVDRLIGLLAKLPGMGPRSARRAALRMLTDPETRMLPLAAARRAFDADPAVQGLRERFGATVLPDTVRPAK